MNAIEIMRQYARDVDSLAKSIRSGEIRPSEDTEEQRQTALSYADSYEYWAACLLMAAHLLQLRVDRNPERYMGIGIENWTGLKDMDGNNLNFGDVAMLPSEGGDPVYYVIKFIQNEFVSTVCKVSGGTRTDLGRDIAKQLKRVGPGSEHPELMKRIQEES